MPTGSGLVSGMAAGKPANGEGGGNGGGFHGYTPTTGYFLVTISFLKSHQKTTKDKVRQPTCTDAKNAPSKKWQSLSQGSNLDKILPQV